MQDAVSGDMQDAAGGSLTEGGDTPEPNMPNPGQYLDGRSSNAQAAIAASNGPTGGADAG
jgi:hypothetical protein